MGRAGRIKPARKSFAQLHESPQMPFNFPMNLKVGRVCPQRAGLRMQYGSGALGTDAPYHYWVQGHNARVCSGNSLPEPKGRADLRLILGGSLRTILYGR